MDNMWGLTMEVGTGWEEGSTGGKMGTTAIT